MGRKPAGEKRLWNAEKQKRYCEKNKEILKEKDKQAKKEKKQKAFKIYEGLPTITQRKGETRAKKKKRRQKNAANNIDEEPLVVDMKFPAISDSSLKGEV